jgi:hypothetical protein
MDKTAQQGGATLVAAAVLEGWAVARLGRKSIVVLAMVLGRLCETFGVDPVAAGTVVYLACDAARNDPEIMRS